MFMKAIHEWVREWVNWCIPPTCGSKETPFPGLLWVKLLSGFFNRITTEICIVFLLIVQHLTSQFLATKCQGHSPNHCDDQNSSPTFPEPWEKGEDWSSLVGKQNYSNGFPPHLVVWEDPCSRVMLGCTQGAGWQAPVKMWINKKVVIKAVLAC